MVRLTARSETNAIRQRGAVAAPGVAVDDIAATPGRIKRGAIGAERQPQKRRALWECLPHRASRAVDNLNPLLAPAVEQHDDARAIGREHRGKGKGADIDRPAGRVEPNSGWEPPDPRRLAGSIRLRRPRPGVARHSAPARQAKYSGGDGNPVAAGVHTHSVPTLVLEHRMRLQIGQPV